MEQVNSALANYLKIKALTTTNFISNGFDANTVIQYTSNNNVVHVWGKIKSTVDTTTWINIVSGLPGPPTSIGFSAIYANGTTTVFFITPNGRLQSQYALATGDYYVIDFTYGL